MFFIEITMMKKPTPKNDEYSLNTYTLPGSPPFGGVRGGLKSFL